jgi:hypothetical protein
VLLIDVDGVLNPLGSATPPGFDAHQLTGDCGRTYTLRMNALHGEWLAGLADVYDLAWATTWWRQADTIARWVGLPVGLPRIQFPRVTFDWPYPWAPKTPHVRRFAAGRRVAWIDDDHTINDLEALTTSYPAGRHVLGDTAPCTSALLLGTVWLQGMTFEHIEALRAWPTRGFVSEYI